MFRWESVWFDLFPSLERTSGPPTQVLIDSSVVMAHRSATIWRRPHDQNPRFNRTYSRTSSLLLTGGEVADCKLGEQLLARLPACEILHRNKGYDSSAIRRQVQDCDAMPNIPPKANWKWKNSFSPFLYHNRNAPERCT
jgi:hypothetical protein